MVDLKDALDLLYELNELRSRAKELREQGRRALGEIDTAALDAEGKVTLKPSKPRPREEWISSGNNVEVGLLVKVQNHQDISEDDNENDKAEAWPPLKKRLWDLELAKLFPSVDYDEEIQDEVKGDRRVPVLVAARSMQALVGRSESVFSKATMRCYYRIVRELYVAARPDWTIGAARAGVGGTTSAFVTGECIRAIFAFKDVLANSARFFKKTERFLGRYQLLKSMRSVLDTDAALSATDASDGSSDPGKIVDRPKTAIDVFADRAIERMWFDWHISTNPREGNIGLHLGNPDNPDNPANHLFLNPTEKPVDMRVAGEYLNGLKPRLIEAVELARDAIVAARIEIADYRNLQKPRSDQPHFEKRMRDYDRAESAHKFAYSLIVKAEAEAESTLTLLRSSEPLKEIFSQMEKRFTQMAIDVNRVLEPSKRYIRTVLNREVASNDFVGRFDAGELVFAAASFGAMTDWKSSELLTRACNLLVEALPENGRLPTTRPFHSTRKGHRMLPIGCEMTRSLAQLLQKTKYEFDAQLARRVLSVFEEKLIEFDFHSQGLEGKRGQGMEKKRVAWNFDGSPDPKSPCVWVTAVSVLAIDRVVRMLNDRINSIVFKYFEVITPQKPHSKLTLNDLVYSDYGLSEYQTAQSRPSLALRLEQMRAHVMRVTLPEVYKDPKGKKEKVFSAIFYGPPGTGKTTLVEALALSSNVPLIRLSPSDLVVQGPAAIEGRARAVFEALSMLTQVVIILDEFEDVVGHRLTEDKEDGKIFQFLRTGMLPKLIKLNDSAKNQSFVYCLATNYLMKIEPAAKRPGRFDLRLPVYDPDPISRAGTLLYRLFRVVERLNSDGDFKQQQPELLAARFLEVVRITGNTRASSFADDYLRLPNWVYDHAQLRPEAFQGEIPLFWYILTAEEKGYQEKADLAKDERNRTIKELEDFKATDGEQRELKWLNDYETKLVPKGRISLDALIGPTALKEDN